jgi:hypothetical protein
MRHLAQFVSIPIQFMWPLALPLCSGLDILHVALCLDLKAPSRNLIWIHLGGLHCIKFLTAACWLGPGLDSTCSSTGGVKKHNYRNLAAPLRFSHLFFVVAIREC